MKAVHTIGDAKVITKQFTAAPVTVELIQEPSQEAAQPRNMTEVMQIVIADIKAQPLAAIGAAVTFLIVFVFLFFILPIILG